MQIYKRYDEDEREILSGKDSGLIESLNRSDLVINSNMESSLGVSAREGPLAFIIPTLTCILSATKTHFKIDQAPKSYEG